MIIFKCQNENKVSVSVVFTNITVEYICTGVFILPACNSTASFQQELISATDLNH